MHPAIRWSKQDPLLESHVYELKETTAVNTTTVMKRKCMILELQVETKEHLDTSSVRVCEENVPMKKRQYFTLPHLLRWNPLDSPESSGLDRTPEMSHIVTWWFRQSPLE